MASDRAASVGRIYDAHVEEVYRFVHRRCGDHALAEDIVQDTFIKAIRSSHDPSELTVGWLMTVARHQLVDVMRRHSMAHDKLRLLDATESGSHTVDPVERLRIESALAALSLDHRLVLTLHYLDGQTVADLAAQLDRTVKSVEGLVTRARRALRRQLGDETESPMRGAIDG